jgi:hypothetical protein
VWQVAYNHRRFFGFWIERAIGQVIGVEVGFDGLEICHASRDDSRSVSSVTELKSFLLPHFAVALANEAG